MRAVTISLLALIPACVTDVGVTDPTDECDVFVESTFPADGATDAFYRAPIEFRLSEPDPTAIVLSDVPGVQWTRDGGEVVVFQPWEPLTPGTAYSFGLDYCGGEPHVAFATDVVGRPLEVDPADLVGTAWWVDLTSGRFVRGEALGALVGALFHDGLWVGIDAVEGGTMSFVVAPPVPSGEHQDFCIATVDLDKGSFVWSPYFEFNAAEVPAWLGESPLPLTRVSVSGAFDPTAERVAGIAWRFVVDARDLAIALDQKDTEALCDLAAGAGAPCEPCPDDVATCIVVEGDSFTARYVPDVQIERVAEPGEHPACDR